LRRTLDSMKGLVHVANFRVQTKNRRGIDLQLTKSSGYVLVEPELSEYR